ncbi:integral membrane protein S linking to the trans Golgi network-domain-containing protein [Xylariomycetidae sp. FL0641]|nr:integral membrane protein S linking to the trans Golgi network-domain-containing protein [Xylariomycetidae sp. FL0641]
MPRRRKPPRSGAIAELPPLRILAQIAALQGIYYVAAMILMSFTTLVAGSKFTLDLVFGWASLRGDTTQGWLIGFVWLCCSGAVVIALVALISRSKLVLDFALTLHIIHLLVVFFYTGFLPRHAAWWFTMIASIGVTVVGGTYGCRWRELRPISFGGKSSNHADMQSALENGTANGDPGDEEMGFSRGRGRGRGRDGAGEYEMVGLPGGSGQ